MRLCSDYFAPHEVFTLLALPASFCLCAAISVDGAAGSDTAGAYDLTFLVGELDKATFSHHHRLTCPWLLPLWLAAARMFVVCTQRSRPEGEIRKKWKAETSRQLTVDQCCSACFWVKIGTVCKVTIWADPDMGSEECWSLLKSCWPLKCPGPFGGGLTV